MIVSVRMDEVGVCVSGGVDALHDAEVNNYNVHPSELLFNLTNAYQTRLTDLRSKTVRSRSRLRPYGG